MAKASLLDRVLRAVLVGVAAFDLVQGLLLLFAPGLLAALLRVPLPTPLFHVWLAGVLQAGLAAGYLIGGMNPARYVGNVALAAVMRMAMAVVLILIGTAEGFIIFTVLGLAEILIGASHALYAVRLRRG